MTLRTSQCTQYNEEHSESHENLFSLEFSLTQVIIRLPKVRQEGTAHTPPSSHTKGCLISPTIGLLPMGNQIHTLS